MTAPLILVDGSSYFFRAYHALPALLTSKGQPTGAVYGVVNMLRRLRKDYAHSVIVVVFDAKGKNFRHTLYPAYKANRSATPPDLLVQFDPLIAILTAMGLPLLTIVGVEADDVIGTLTLQAKNAGQPVLISTGDKDMAQLVDQDITLINTMTNEVLTVDTVNDKFGVLPTQMVDYLALVGDSVDNVPGVPSCGPKTAAKWLSVYQSLENLMAHAGEISGKIGEKLQSSLDFLPLAKQLVTIKTDLVLSYQLSDLVARPPDQVTLLNWFRDLEFKTWLKEALAANPAPCLQPSAPFTVVTTQQGFDALVKQLCSATLICLDTETTSFEAIEAQIVGISLAVAPDAPYYIPLLHQDGSVQLDKAAVIAALKPVLENPAIQKVGQNLKYDYQVFQNEGVKLAGMAFDTMLESYLLNSVGNRHDLGSLALKYLGLETISFEDVVGKGAKQLQFDAVSVDKAAPYAAEDADLTLKLHHLLYGLLDDRLRSVLTTIEMPLVPILAEMESRGVLIDTQALAVHGERLRKRMVELETQAYALAGRAFNLNSPKQLQTLLFEELGLPVLTKTPTGQPSTAESVLQELAYTYPLPRIVLEYRSLAKLVSTYIEALPRQINPRTGRVHTHYNQAVTATGRLSSTDPNLQNIPIRTEEGRLIRRAFIAPPGACLMAFDYSQIELRIMAHLSGDPGLLQAFAADLDIHQATAAEIFQLPLETINAEQRRRAKAINFGLIYGMSAFGLSKQLGIRREEAEAYMQTYFQRYPGVLAYMAATREKASAAGYVETLFGRRLYVPDINASQMMRRKAAERIAINAPMQGTAADIIKKAMMAVSLWQQQNQCQGIRLLMQVHDELVFEVDDQSRDLALAHIPTLMEQAVQLAVPLKVSTGVGLNWDEAH